MAWKGYQKKPIEEFDLPFILGRHLDRTSQTICTVAEFGEQTEAKAITLYTETLEFENLVSNSIKDEENKKTIDNHRNAINFDNIGGPRGYVQFFLKLSLWRKSLIQIATSSGLIKRDVINSKALTELDIDGERDMDESAETP